MTDREHRVLTVLSENRHAWLGPGYIWHLAFGDTEPYRGRRDAGMTSTLDALRRRGLVADDLGTRHSTGRVWRITDEGLREVAA